MAKPNTHLVWQGPSQLDGAPIGVFITLKSGNSKTANMVQAYILRTDVSPLDAVFNGADAGICGDCKHRGVPRVDPPKSAKARKASVWSAMQERACYVVVAQGPRSIYAAWKRGTIPTTSIETVATLINGRNVRLGAYGDPAAVPVEVWQALGLNRWTAYTHQWHKGANLQAVAMASVDSIAEYAAAKAAGYRTFRVKAASEPMMPNEIACPASEEMGKRSDCNTCLLCNGSKGSDDRRKDIVINSHGAGASNFVTLQSLRKVA